VRWKKVLFLILATLILASSFIYSYRVASKGAYQTYVGDEVWYVPAARNALHRLGISVHYYTHGSAGVNVIFRNWSDFNQNYYKVESMALSDYYVPTTNMSEYQKFPGIYILVPKKDEKSFVRAVEEKYGRYCYVVTGYRYPDKDNIQNYLNLEHPFLGKDLIMLGMMIEDRPIDWRLPGICAKFVIGVLVLYLTYRISKSYLAALIALGFVAYDPLLTVTSAAAMLDIYVALFVTVFMVFFVLNRRYLSGFTLGLAAATKLSGAFVYPLFFLTEIKRERSRGTSFKDVLFYVGITLSLAVLVVGYGAYLGHLTDLKYVYIGAALTAGFSVAFYFLGDGEGLNALKFIGSTFALPVVGFMLPNLVGVKLVGLSKWLNGYIGGWGWMFAPNKGPVIAPVWDWFIDANPFPFHYNPNLFAKTDPTLLIAMIPLVFALLYLHRRMKRYWRVFLSFWMIVLMFLVHAAYGYLRNGKLATQFSFYATPLVPLAAISVGAAAAVLIRWGAFSYTLLGYLLWIGRFFRIKRFVRYAEERLGPGFRSSTAGLPLDSSDVDVEVPVRGGEERD